MGENTNIEWADHSWNPWEGCTKVSAGCANCYAEKRNARFGKGKAPNWGPGAPRRRTSVKYWNDPVRWNRETEEAFAQWRRSARCSGLAAGIHPRRPRVFCASLADIFDDEVPIEWFADALDLVRRTPNLDWLWLTKRPENWRKRLSDWGGYSPHAETQGLAYDWLRGNPPANVWIGTTVEDQEMADKRIPELLSIPAKVRFLSCEPLLEGINLRGWLGSTRFGNPIHWVIAGGESGPKARPMHPGWARSLRDQCKAAGVPFLFKQWGEWLPDTQRGFTTSGDITWGLVHTSGRFRLVLNNGKRDWSQDTGWADGESGTTKVGKARAGRLLDGVEHNEFPEAYKEGA